ncbi:ImmA/IrrE family metallo-endopeptidase [Peptoniphilus sp. EMRHCC_23]|uniref:ImmA/IrrE family metallo-endopeptidase n=1 Tax=Peptoniphilus rachelemmaiella TaxID=2811779 RepID=UPI001C007DFB|nr:ImmA/IrrE family metallo-endopeptidase [Peptoniphilus rachelemmaiella]
MTKTHNRYRHLYDDANGLRARYGTDPKAALEALGVGLVTMATSTKLLGMYKMVLNKPFVFYNDRVPAPIQRMVLAHELGHHLYHRHHAEKEELIEYTLFHLTDAMELEANIFSAHFLLEDEAVYAMARAGYSYMDMARAFSVDVNLMIFKLNEMQRMGYDLPPLDPADNQFYRKIDGRNLAGDL